MLKPPLPESEQNRLAILKSYEVLDTLPEKLYDNITFLASQICGTPIALVSLIDETRQWFKSRVGLAATETARELSFCGHAILQRGVFQISNSLEDPRFSDNPLVKDDPRVIFYAGAPLQTPTGEQIGTLCVIDHQPRTLTSQQIESLEALADQVVALLEMRLSEREAKNASRAKSEFLANMSHEIRTPLGAILGFSEILRDPLLGDKERKEYLEIVSRNGKMLSHLVDDILDLSKVEANQVVLDLNDCNVNELLENICAVFRATAIGKGIEFTIEVSPEVPGHLIIDATRVRQVLNNVVGNAIKFTNQGSVKLKVSYGQKQLVFTVTDTGRGISPEQTTNLFQPFVQADKSTTREYGGTGLGLHLTRRLCELLGGSFSLLSSQLGVGSAFVATVSAAVSEETKEIMPHPYESGAKHRIEPGSLTGMKILLVDDSSDNQILFQVILKKSGAVIEFASDGQEGVDKTLAGEFDVVFMDLQMPVMDGHEATRALRKANFKKPVVALTAHAMKEERLRTVQSGFSDYLSKPINRSELSRVLSSICGVKKTN